jgi:hypothetical protein
LKFYEYGCENCDFLDMHENREKISEFTTINFDG